MAKKHKHEDHTNHEAWAIPYGDLVTLLLALFVVMYSMSAINEGKFRVAADSLNAAFKGPPRTPSLIQLGPKALGQGDSGERKPPAPQTAQALGIQLPKMQRQPGMAARMAADTRRGAGLSAREKERLEKMSEEVQKALGDLISRELVVVRRHDTWLEVEIQTDILFASGSAQIGAAALPVIDRLAGVFKPFDNRVRIEGHTDDRPIATGQFPSNWELSSARAASVVHRFMAQGVDPRRMTVLGLAEYQPVADNAVVEGRNRNRRVVLVVTAKPGGPALPPLSAAASEVEAGPESAPLAVELAEPVGAGAPNMGHAES